jgi:hypothetical protein
MARNGSDVSSGLVVHNLGRRFICSLHWRLEKILKGVRTRGRSAGATASAIQASFNFETRIVSADDTSAASG